MHSGTHILHRFIHDELPIAVKGDGPYIIDSEGKRYLDASGGAAVSCLGHSHPRVAGGQEVSQDRRLRDPPAPTRHRHRAVFQRERLLPAA